MPGVVCGVPASLSSPRYHLLDRFGGVVTQPSGYCRDVLPACWRCGSQRLSASDRAIERFAVVDERGSDSSISCHSPPVEQFYRLHRFEE